MQSTTQDRDFLKQISLLVKMPDDDFDRVCNMIERVPLSPGQVLFEEGSEGKQAYIIRTGEVEIFKYSGGREVLLAVRGPGEVIGEMSLLQAMPRTATVRAHTETLLLAFSQEQFDQLLDTSPSAARAILETVLERWRANEAMLRQSEKMAQLGTLVAGIAHEINNPSAAVQRSSGQLGEAIIDLNAAYVQLNCLSLTIPQWQTLIALEKDTRQRVAQPPILDSLTRSDRETELEDWLSSREIDEPWTLTPVLVSLEYNTARLGELAAAFNDVQFMALIQWLCSIYTVYSLLGEIGQGSEQVSGIVKALKSYSYLDQAPVQEVDIHEGLETTLTILKSKLKSGITLQRDYDLALPHIQAYGSELNQVWTNIIDNAIYALQNSASPDQGRITLRTMQGEDGWVRVEIEDNGPGIPPEVLPRIFDPFFTTKPPGQGTGLGLDISYNIVVFKHRGDICVDSAPGRTCFQVRLPVNFEEH